MGWQGRYRDGFRANLERVNNPILAVAPSVVRVITSSLSFMDAAWPQIRPLIKTPHQIGTNLDRFDLERDGLTFTKAVPSTLSTVPQLP